MVNTLSSIVSGFGNKYLYGGRAQRLVTAMSIWAMGQDVTADYGVCPSVPRKGHRSWTRSRYIEREKWEMWNAKKVKTQNQLSYLERYIPIIDFVTFGYNFLRQIDDLF